MHRFSPRAVLAGEKGRYLGIEVEDALELSEQIEI